MTLLQKEQTIILRVIHCALCATTILACVSLCACQSNTNAVYDLLVFRTEIKNHCSEYTPEDWDRAFDRYAEISQRLSEMQFTDEERMEIAKVEGEIAGYAASAAIVDVKDEIKNILEDATSFSEGFIGTFELPQN